MHLGCDACEASKAVHVLKKVKAHNIIVNGDLFDSRYLHRLKKHHWKVLSTLRKLSSSCNVILTLGNHDYYDSDTLYDLLGFEVKQSHSVTINNKHFLFIHGHVFDFLMTEYKWLSDLSSEIYYFICKNNLVRKYLNQWLHDKTKSLFRIDRNMKAHAINYAKKHKYDFVICGHTHFPEIDNELGYANSGAFTISTPTYITIDDYGNVKLNYIDIRSNLR